MLHPIVITKTLTAIGQSSLPQACPVCLHEPVKGDDCRPNKALRTTVKVFLRKKGIEREAARKKELVDKAATFPATSAMNLVDMSSVAKQPEVSIRSTTRDIDNNLAGSGPQNGSDVTQSMNSIDNAVVPKISPLEEHKDIPRPSIEVSISARILEMGLIVFRPQVEKPRKKARKGSL